jgi:hypothetical protein
MHQLEKLESAPDYDTLLCLIDEMKYVNRSLGELGHEFKRRSREVQLMADHLAELQKFIDDTGHKLKTAVRLSYQECRKVADRAIKDPVLRKKIFLRDGNKCRECGASELLTVDHFIPVYYNGTSDEDNLQTLCLTCNASKGKTLPDARMLRAKAGCAINSGLIGFGGCQ